MKILSPWPGWRHRHRKSEQNPWPRGSVDRRHRTLLLSTVPGVDESGRRPGVQRHLNARQADEGSHTSVVGHWLLKAQPLQARRPVARQKLYRVTATPWEAVLRFQVQPEAKRWLWARLSPCPSAGKAESFAAGQITLCHTPCQRPDSADISRPFGDTNRAPGIEQIEAV